MDIKSIIYSLIALTAISLSSCGAHEGKDISEYENPTSADSLLFFLVQLRAHEYWDQAVKDTAMRSPKARAQFIAGFRKGFNSIKEADDDYNRGLELGYRMAINLQKFEKMYDIEIPKEMATSNLQYGLRDGAEIPEFKYQDSYYQILNRLKKEQRDRDHERAQMTLEEGGNERQMTKISDNLYFRLIKKGGGPNAQYGQSAHVIVNYERADGEDIAVPSPGLVTIGAHGVPDALNNAYTRLNKGAVGQFLTTAEAVFGTRTYIMGMKPEDVLLVTITLNEIISPHGAAVDSI